MAEKNAPQQGTGEQALGGAEGLVNSDKLKNIAGKGNQEGQSGNQGDQQGQPAQEVKKVKPKVGGSQVDPDNKGQQGQPPAGQEPAKREPIVIDSPFGKQIFGDGDEEGNVVLKNFEDVQKFGKVYGHEFKDVNDLQTFIVEHSSLKDQVGDLAKTKGQFDSYKRTISSLPDEVAAIMDAAINNRSWMEIVNSLAKQGSLNFEKDFDAYNERDLINHYSSKKYTNDELNELEPDQYNALKDMARTRYTTQKEEYSNRVNKQRKATEDAQIAFDQSVDVALAKLKTSYPKMEESKIQRVRDIMTSELQSTLFNADNTYKEDAAERIAMQEFGKETILAQQHTIADVLKMHENQGASKATEQILGGSDKPRLSGTGAPVTDDMIAEAVKKETSFLQAR